MTAVSTLSQIIPGVPRLLWGGLEDYTDDLMFSSALRVGLDFAGEKRSKIFLASTSSGAFELGWARGTMISGAGGAIFAHPNHFEPGLDNLFKALGRRYTVVYRSEPERLWQAASESIDAGHPVIAAEWALDHFALLAGYDPAKHRFLGRRYGRAREVPEEYVSIKPDDLSFIIVIGDKARKRSSAQAARQALQLALASARTGRKSPTRGQGGTGEPLIYGPQAYLEHARLIPDQLDPRLPDFAWREHVLRWQLDALQLARAYAVLYLKDIAADFPPVARKHLEAAQAGYCELLGYLALDNHHECKPKTELGGLPIQMHSPQVRCFTEAGKFWCEDGRHSSLQDLCATREGRQKFANWLLKLKAADEQALAELEKAVPALELSGGRSP